MKIKERASGRKKKFANVNISCPGDKKKSCWHNADTTATSTTTTLPTTAQLNKKSEKNSKVDDSINNHDDDKKESDNSNVKSNIDGYNWKKSFYDLTIPRIVKAVVDFLPESM